MITGGFSSVPSAIAFGTILPGKDQEQTVTVYDSAAVPRRVASVTTSLPDRLSVDLMPPEVHETSTRGPDGVRVARVRVRADSSVPGPLNGSIVVQFVGDGRPPDVIPVSGRVASAVEVSPSAVLLPQTVGGKVVNEATCVCRSTRGQPIALSVEEIPGGFSVDIDGKETAATTRRVTIRVDPNTAPASKTVAVRLRATTGHDSYAVTIPITLWRE